MCSNANPNVLCPLGLAPLLNSPLFGLSWQYIKIPNRVDGSNNA